MLLDPETLDLLPAAARVHAELGDVVSLRTELLAAQVETASPVCATIGEAAASGRRMPAACSRPASTAGRGWPAPARTRSPTPRSMLIDDPKYAALIEEFPWVLSRQNAFGLHVHVAVRGADRALAVHNALRSYLPDARRAGRQRAAARRAATPASPRCGPKLCEPAAAPGRAARLGARGRQRADYERWGRRGGVFPGAGEPWYELRVHDEHGDDRAARARHPEHAGGGGRRARVRRRAGGLARRAPRRRRVAAGPRPRPHRREPLARDAPRPRRVAARPRQRRAAAHARTRASR